MRTETGVTRSSSAWVARRPRTYANDPVEVHACERVNKKQSAIERLSTRLDVSSGFERCFLWGLQKMRLRCKWTLVIILVTALGRAKENQQDTMRASCRPRDGCTGRTSEDTAGGQKCYACRSPMVPQNGSRGSSVQKVRLWRARSSSPVNTTLQMVRSVGS